MFESRKIIQVTFLYFRQHLLDIAGRSIDLKRLTYYSPFELLALHWFLLPDLTQALADPLPDGQVFALRSRLDFLHFFIWQ